MRLQLVLVCNAVIVFTGSGREKRACKEDLSIDTLYDRKYYDSWYDTLSAGIWPADWIFTTGILGDDHGIDCMENLPQISENERR